MHNPAGSPRNPSILGIIEMNTPEQAYGINVKERPALTSVSGTQDTSCTADCPTMIRIGKKDLIEIIALRKGILPFPLSHGNE
jgi:hypothetical protein